MDIGNSFENVLDTIIGFIPNLLGFLLILLIGYLIAKIVAGVVRKVLEKVGIDQKVQQSDANRYVDAVLPGARLSGGIARLVFWLIFVFFLVTAIGALQIPTATNFMNEVLAFLPNVIVAILIFVVAALLSGAVAGGVAKVMGDTTTGKVVAAVVPALIMVIAMFMILEQLQIAPEIVRIAFAAVMFAIALALALAFGLGGRDVAARLLEDAHRKTRENADTIKDDLARGRTALNRVPAPPSRRGPAPTMRWERATAPLTTATARPSGIRERPGTPLTRAPTYGRYAGLGRAGRRLGMRRHVLRTLGDAPARAGPARQDTMLGQAQACYSPPPPAKNPRWPLQESPGWKPDALSWATVAPAARSAFWTCPQFWGGAPGPEGEPGGRSSPSSRPENAQMELVWAGPLVGLPLPVTSPADAGEASASAATTIAGATRRRRRMRVLR